MTRLTESVKTEFIKAHTGKIRSWKNEKAQSKFKAYCINEFALSIDKETFKKDKFYW